jgi:hypothetical protein
VNAYQQALSQSLDTLIVVLEQPYLDADTRSMLLEVKASLEAQIECGEPSLLERVRRFLTRKEAA